MSDLTIEHTAGDGTLLRGSARGDGVAALLKPLGWRWGRTLSAWYLPRSRDTAPRAAVIEDTTTTLRAAGHAVTITLDHEPRTPAEVAQDRQRRSRARADRLEAPPLPMHRLRARLAPGHRQDGRAAGEAVPSRAAVGAGGDRVPAPERRPRGRGPRRRLEHRQRSRPRRRPTGPDRRDRPVRRRHRCWR
ncbi:conserved protein of unknown function [Micropruina glycogenica]|uniref:Uncharacterized protein n=1 Tax=Micropruina glycogenica TaxID=75385 RepID=A0A2N9JCU1_9ACTN|nr:conserved protein of unknown function [Micropruina glycogenica]